MCAGGVLIGYYIMTHLIHIKTLLSKADYYDHFKDEETEVWREGNLLEAGVLNS